MGNPKLKWTADEEDALKAGVARYGAGKWKHILVDSDFQHRLANRSNVDLKDKWRNMGCSVGQSSGANATTPRGKATTVASPPETTSSSKDKINAKSPKSPDGVKTNPKYNEMILEALSSLKDSSGSDFGAIVGFIENKYEVPQTFRRLLGPKLRKLVIQGRIEKVQKRYKIKQLSLGIKTPSPKQKIVRSKPIQVFGSTISTETVEDAAKTAAYKIAEAEHKSFVAAEAVEESERVSQMADDADVVVSCLKEIFRQFLMVIGAFVRVTIFGTTYGGPVTSPIPKFKLAVGPIK